VMAAIGRTASVVTEGEFSFERDSSGDGWHVDDEKFPDEFRKSIQQGRVRQLEEERSAQP
jgi:hypothetical protein